MGTDTASEKTVIFNQLTLLTDREDFINFSHRKSLKYYTITFQQAVTKMQSPYVVHIIEI
jgi:hypothetical protein